MKKYVVLLSGLIAGSMCFAKEVSIADYSSNTTITAAEFKDAQDDAGYGGIVTFGAKYYKISEPLVVTKGSLSVIGAGTGKTFITYAGTGKLSAIFKTPKDGFTVQQMHLRGGDWPTYEKELDLSAGSRVKKGVESAIFVQNDAMNIKATNVKMTKVSVGIEYQKNKLPHGLEVTDCVFSTGRCMINASNSGNAEVSGSELELPMKINNADFNLEPGHGARGIIFDFGNVGDYYPDNINLKRSYIKNSNMDRMMKWQVGTTNTRNLTIEGNTLYGGGASDVRTSEAHCIHFEDTVTGVQIKKNKLYQQKKNTAGVVMDNLCHIYAAAGGHGPNEISLTNINKFYGYVNIGSISGLFALTSKNNRYNSTYGGKEKVINGWQEGSSVTLKGYNTVNGVEITNSQIKVK